MADIIVSGAGTAGANGLYTYRGTFQSRNYYLPEGEPNGPPDDGRDGIRWESDHWTLTESGLVDTYYSFDDVATPDLAIWLVGDGSSPAPTVSISGGQNQPIWLRFGGVPGMCRDRIGRSW